MPESLLGKSGLERWKVNPSSVKIIAFVVFYLAIGLGLSFVLSQLFAEPSGFRLFLFLAAIIVFLSLFLLLPLLIKNFLWLAAVILLGTLTLSGLFFAELARQPVLWLGLLISFFLFLGAAASVRREYQNMLNIRFHRLAAAFLPTAFTGLIIFLLLIFYFNFFSSPSFFFSEAAWENFLIFSSWPFQSRTAVFSRPVGEVLRDLASSQLAADPAFAQATTTVRNAAVEQSVDGFLDQFSRFLNIDIDKRWSGAKVLYQALRENFLNLTPPLRNLVNLGLLAALFLIFKALSQPLIWVINVFSFLVYEFLVAVSFISTTYENRSKEIVIL